MTLAFEPTICLYHSPCADGTVAAAIVARRYPNCRLMPVNYQTDLPSVTHLMLHSVLVVDFCPPEATLIEWSKVASDLLVLDHHPATFQHPKLVVDETRCGASLVWDTLFADRPRPWLVRHIHDYDLWHHQYPDTHAIIAAVNSYPLEDSRWRGWIEDDEGYCLPALTIEGRALLRDQDRRANDLTARFMGIRRFLGFVVPVTNVVSSDKAVINRLGDKHGAAWPFSVFWSIDCTGRYHISLRSKASNPEHVDVGALATAIGGGGHPNAAGVVTLSLSHLIDAVDLTALWAEIAAISVKERRERALEFYRSQQPRTERASS